MNHIIYANMVSENARMQKRIAELEYANSRLNHELCEERRERTVEWWQLQDRIEELERDRDAAWQKVEKLEAKTIDQHLHITTDLERELGAYRRLLQQSERRAAVLREALDVEKQSKLRERANAEAEIGALKSALTAHKAVLGF